MKMKGKPRKEKSKFWTTAKHIARQTNQATKQIRKGREQLKSDMPKIKHERSITGFGEPTTIRSTLMKKKKR